MAPKNVRLKGAKGAISREPRLDTKLVNNNATAFKWCLHCDYICFDHEYYGLSACFTNGEFINIIKPQLDLYARKTWAEVMGANKSNHTWEVQDIRDNKLKQIYINMEIETAYQLCVPGGHGRHRLWGHRQDNVFYLVANDPDHQGCPVEKKYT